MSLSVDGHCLHSGIWDIISPSGWGYNNISELEYVLAHFDEADLPLDAMWSDLEIYKDSANFDYDEERYPHEQMQALYAKYKKRWISIVQAYIPNPTRLSLLDIPQCP
jgi:alpha-glucosidase (family GH31 glycosyl hydrolase)